MRIRYFKDNLGISVLTDEDVDGLEGFDEIEGVEDVNIGRYHVDARYGFLFDINDMHSTVIDFLRDRYPEADISEMSNEDLIDKLIDRIESQKRGISMPDSMLPDNGIIA